MDNFSICFEIKLITSVFSPFIENPTICFETNLTESAFSLS